MSSRELLDNIITQLKKKEGLDSFYKLFDNANEYTEDIKEILMGKVDGSKEQLFEHIISNSYYKDFSYLINETLKFDDGTYNAINEHVWEILNGKYDEIDASEEEEEEKHKKMDVLDFFLTLIYETEAKYEDQQQMRSKITTKKKLMEITQTQIDKTDGNKKEKLIKKLANFEKELNNLIITQQEKGMGKYKKKTIKKKKHKKKKHKKKKSVKKKPKKKKPKKKKSSEKKKKRNTIKRKKNN